LDPSIPLDDDNFSDSDAGLDADISQGVVLDIQGNSRRWLDSSEGQPLLA